MTIIGIFYANESITTDVDNMKTSLYVSFLSFYQYVQWSKFYQVLEVTFLNLFPVGH